MVADILLLDMDYKIHYIILWILGLMKVILYHLMIGYLTVKEGLELGHTHKHCPVQDVPTHQHVTMMR